MTNLEALNAVVGYASPDDNIPIKALIDQQVDPAGDYLPGNASKIDTAAIAVLMAFKLLSKIDEGGFGVTFNTDSADKTIKFLYQKSGGTPGGAGDPLQGSYPSIRNVGNKW